MKRVEVEADQMPGQDSFLDVITNIVGILILLVLVVGLRTSHSVRGGPGVASAEHEQNEKELRTAYNTALSTEKTVSELVHRVSDARHESAFREEERIWLGTTIATAEKEIADRRAKLGADGQQDFDVRHKLATAQATLDELTRAQVALMARDPKTEEIECTPTPLAKAVVGTQVHVMLCDDHVAIVPLDELIAIVGTDFRSNVWRLREQSDMQRTVGPIDGFRCRYWAEKDDIVARSEAGNYTTGASYHVSHCHLIPVATPPGDPAADAINPNSEFFRRLRQHRVEGTTITIWAYPKTYDRLRELKRGIREIGFSIAVRPMPNGVPIGASSRGSNSLAE